MKKLTLILALLLVAGITVAAYAEVQNVKVSGDITAYGISRQLGFQGKRDINNDGTGTQVQQMYKTLATITRVKVDADLTDNVMTTVRLLNERYWGNENTTVGDTGVNTDIFLDLAFVTLKEFLYSPLTLTIGRQELHFGSDMIIGDPDTNNMASTASVFGNTWMNKDSDLSARKAFDAIRATLDYNPLVIDAIMAKIDEGSRYRQDDVNLYGINANYKIGGKYLSTAEAYWFEKRTGRGTAAGRYSGKKVDQVDTLGARLTATPHSRMSSSLEVAIQTGRGVPPFGADMPTVRRKAWALEASSAVDLKDKIKYAPTVAAMYAYFSGEALDYTTDVGAYRGWDPMFENQTSGNIANTLFNQTNVHVLGGIATAQATEDVKLKAEYYAYWWAKAFPEGAIVNTVRDPFGVGDPDGGYCVTNKRFAGQEIDLTATYDYTEDVQFALMGGAFIPGSAFEKGNNTPAKEIIGSMKVTF